MPETSSIRNIEPLAYWIGKKMCAHFYWTCREDFNQTVQLAILETREIEDVKARSLGIRRRFYYTLKDYGYRRAADGYTWVLKETQADIESNDVVKLSGDDHSTVQGKRPCGVPFCKRISSNNEAKYGRVCARCLVWVNKRKRKGLMDIYKGLEDNARFRPM